ncbi:hypothetical protein D3C86_1964590 [compost metagenome]
MPLSTIMGQRESIQGSGAVVTICRRTGTMGMSRPSDRPSSPVQAPEAMITVSQAMSPLLVLTATTRSPAVSKPVTGRSTWMVTPSDRAALR